MKNLLEKTRRLNKSLQSFGPDPVSFSKLSEKLSSILNANVYIANKRGKILGYELSKGFECDTIESEIVNERKFPNDYNEELLGYRETKENIKQEAGCVAKNL